MAAVLPLWLEVGPGTLRLGDVTKTFSLGKLDYIKEVVYYSDILLSTAIYVAQEGNSGIRE